MFLIPLGELVKWRLIIGLMPLFSKTRSLNEKLGEGEGAKY
jgi:hypothetical protein